MPAPTDFRQIAFAHARTGESGRYVGKSAYWRLYSIENVLRVVIHSTLSAMVDPNWWGLVIDGDKNGRVQALKQDYLNHPGATMPGPHDIYYLFLSDLTKILADQRQSFLHPIPDIDKWIVNLERIRLPRNIVGHMNWPTVGDRRLIDEVYRASKGLVRKFRGSGIALVVP